MRDRNTKKESKKRDNGRKQVVILVPLDILAALDAALLRQYRVGGKRSQHLLGLIEAYIADSQATEAQ